MPTGEVELKVDELHVLSTSTPLPFQLDEENVDESLRQRYRWLDLRRPHMQRNIRTRAHVVRVIRDEMEREGFVDIETPILWKPTPEGARDFVVPSRLQPGHFFALPQSPQIAKQLLVMSGFERYYQIARCFRDEDLRADRLQELTQLDVEMAFPDQDFLFGLMERIVERIWRETIGVELEARRFGACRTTRRCSASASTGPTCASAWRSRRRPRTRAAPSSASSRTRRRSATSPCPKELLALRAAGAREPRALVGREGARLHRLPRRRRGLVADREVPRRTTCSSAGASPATRCSSSPTSRASSPRCSGSCASSSGASSS